LSVWFFWASALALGLGYVGAAWLVSGKFGNIVRGIRDDELRVRFLGYPVEVYKLVVFTLSAMICGVAGALYYPQAGIINPDEIAPIASIYLAVWVAIGGRGRLYGAVIGAAVVSCPVDLLHRGRAPDVDLGFYRIDWIDWWPVLLGLGFVLVTLFAPKGLAGLFDYLVRKEEHEHASGGQGVSVSFDGFKAINNLSFTIGLPEMRAVIGPNGAGKTTFMDIVTGKTRPDEGTVRWGEMGHSLLSMSEAQIAREGIGRKFQRPTVFEDQSVRDNLRVALKKPRGPFARCSTGSAPTTARGSRRSRVRSALPSTRPQGGHPQPRAEAVAGDRDAAGAGPALLLVDEPAPGMTTEERNHTADLPEAAGEVPCGRGRRA
jgi:ABC-type uncharacterized transport system ATPase subunit